MRIAVDAMGGDFAPVEIVAGAVDAAARCDHITRVYLVGDEQAVRNELSRYPAVSEKIEVRHAAEVVSMGDTPALAVRKKKDSSISRSVDLVKSGEADAVVSAGNTGGVVVAATLKLRLQEGVLRPAIATVIPTLGRPLVLIDSGATIDCTPEMLVQFACMGTVYSRNVLGQAKPIVGLMSVGGEDSKGNEITKETFRLLSASHLNFRGNVEGHDIFRGETDVVVCDGFVGNIVLKTAESAGHAIGKWLKQELTSSLARKIPALMLSGAFRKMKERMDPEHHGGAPLLGVNGTCIITHGSSTRRGIYHAMRVACRAVENHMSTDIVDEIKRLGSGS